MTDLTDLRDRMRTFTAERDWARFHDPKSLVLALTGEVGELAEVFQWVRTDDAVALSTSEPMATDIRDELADVLLYLVRLADVLDVDLHEAAVSKMAKNAIKHPARSERPEAAGVGTVDKRGR